MPQISFTEKQLNHLFPYFIVFDKNLCISNRSIALTSQLGDCIGKPFSEFFTVVEPNDAGISYEKLIAQEQLSLKLQFKNQRNALLSGKLEVLTEDLLLFAGSKSEEPLTYPSVGKTLEERLNILSQIVENNIHSVTITDLQDRITWVNSSFTELTQFTLQEALGQKPEHLLGGKNTSGHTLNYLNSQVANAKPFNSELINYKKDGTPYWGRINGQTIHSNDGDATGFFTVIEDITVQKQIEEKAALAEEEFKLALEQITHFWEHNFDTGITTFSKGNIEFWDVQGKDFEERKANWWNKIHTDGKEIIQENIKSYRLGLIDSHNEKYRFYTSEGDVKWVLDQGVVVKKDTSGQPLKLIGTHTDITGIKETEESLERALGQFKSLSEHLPIVLYEYEYRSDGSDGMRYISSAIDRVFGLKPHEFWNKKSISDVDQRRIDRKQQYSRRTLKPFYDECQITTPSKGPRWYAISSVYSYTTQQDAIVYTGFMVDITERKAVEDSIRVNEEKYRSILASMKLGMLEVDNEGIITYVNKSFCYMSGYKEKELLGINSKEIFSDNLQKISETNANGVLPAYELEALNKSREQKWWMVSVAPRYNEKSEQTGSVGIYLDITENKAQEKELVKARIDAERLAQAKETFLANMSHEMRTPMHAIMSMTSQLEKTNLDSSQNFYLETVRKASKGLLVLINDVLDLSKIDAGQLSLEYIGFDLMAELLDAIKVVTHKAELKGIVLNEQFVQGTVAPVLTGDPHRLKQIIINLLTNAIKFTEKGSVTVNCKVLEDRPDAQLIEIAVQDTGIGMEQSYVARIFDKFSQEHESVSRKYGGTGLGMSISKSLIEQMGGTITVDSKKSVGTRVTLNIEFEKGSKQDLPENKIITFNDDFLDGKKILITDDNDLNRLVASILLLNYGATVIVAENGEDALEMIGKNSFDLVLMDVQMPVLNGYETTRILRSQGYTLPIIALTASAIEGEREKCIAEGMNDYITKPIEEQLFLQKIDKWLNETDIMRALVPNEEKKEEQDNNPLYTLDSLIQISKGREDFVIKMAALFCTQMPIMVQEMKIAFLNNNLLEMGSVAHKLKSNIDHLKVSRIQRVIRNIEELGNEQINDKSLATSIELVEQTINETVNSLKEKFPVVN
ncbi:PAS domain S-box-containing protein [Pedobacter sp. UYP30]|uniref:PAS domain S-box protein n=1 Tax=Pedobacter sp. UYP30 TaxID=1756400 RepID=UPI003396A2AE